MKLMTMFAFNVRKMRKQRGLTQEKLAELADLDRTYIGLIERGQRNVTIRSIEKIANALEVPAHILLKEIKLKRSKKS